MSDVRFSLFKGVGLYNRALDAYAMRQQAITRNIANAGSENYRPEQVKFEEFLQEAQSSSPGLRTEERHIPIGIDNSNTVEGVTVGADIPKPELYMSGASHVNVDKEMSDLAENQLKFRFAAKKASGFFRDLNSAIRGSQQ
jgi:flagellar basal-body rod protein FlgB